MSRQIAKVSDPKKVSNELFSLTYGSLVAQILKDYENDEDVNKQLERMEHVQINGSIYPSDLGHSLSIFNGSTVNLSL